MPNPLYNSDLISIRDLSRETIALILDTATQYKNHSPINLLKNKIVAHCFFEPSTRTRLSFEAATLRLGGQNIGFTNSEDISVKKGESLSDTIKVIQHYADLIVIRHPKAGAARLAAETSAKPVINAGDGSNQHPTQALLDLFTIQDCQSRLEEIHIAFAGDLKYSRTVHSLAEACALFNMRLYFIATENFELPNEIFDLLKMKGVKFSCHQDLKEVINKIDILYMTRMQLERFSQEAPQMIKNKKYLLTHEMLTNVKPNLKILHPLPRNEEIELAIDNTHYAYYFQQTENGVCLRQAILSLLLNEQI